MIRSLRSSDPVKRIRAIALFVSTMLGISSGLALFIWGPLFYEQIAAVSSAQMGMSLTAVLIALTNVLGFCLEVPTGAVGDALGRKWSVVVSFLCKMMQMLCLVLVTFCESLPLIISVGFFSIFFFELAYTFYSGTFVAWCVDSLRKEAPEIGYENILAPVSKFRSLGTMLGGVVGILLYVNGWAYWAFSVSAICCFLCAAYCLAEMEDDLDGHYLDHSQLSVKAVTSKMGEVVGDAFTAFRREPVILAAVSVFAAFMAVLNLAEYFWPIYVRSNVDPSELTMSWVLLAATTQLARAVGSSAFLRVGGMLDGKSVRGMGSRVLRRVLSFTSLSVVAPVLWLSWLTVNDADTFAWCVVVVLAIQMAYGVIAPCFETLVNNYIPDKNSGERATVLSFASLLRGLIVTLLAVPTGGTSGESTTAGWAIPAVVLLVVVYVANRVMRKAERKAPDILQDGSLLDK